MEIRKKPFGLLSSGEEISLFILSAGEYTACLTDYGATWVSFIMPDANGMRDDVLLGFPTLNGYVHKHPFFGSTVGRFANRIRNARFSIDGKEYHLWANEGSNHLHGGRRGFDKQVWQAETDTIGGDPAVRFSRTSPDGEEGYPGNLEVVLTVSLSAEGIFQLHYHAVSDAKTPVNLTNHAYFNLAGEGRGTILNHIVQLNSNMYLPVDSESIPLEKPAPVDGTPFDFTSPKPIGRDIEITGAGYDHCFLIEKNDSTLQKDGHLASCARVLEPSSGRSMEVRTTLPGLQFYTGNKLNGIPGKRGSLYGAHAGFCMETEFYPDSPNRPDFPSPYIEPGAAWDHRTIYAFDVKSL